MTKLILNYYSVYMIDFENLIRAIQSVDGAAEQKLGRDRFSLTFLSRKLVAVYGCDYNLYIYSSRKQFCAISQKFHFILLFCICLIYILSCKEILLNRTCARFTLKYYSMYDHGHIAILFEGIYSFVTTCCLMQIGY